MRWLYGTLFVMGLAGAAFAAMQRGPVPPTAAGENGEASLFDQAEAAARAGECRVAIRLLEGVLAKSADEPDSLSLLAYCQRKTGRLDDAFANYRRALDLRPEFPVAREYLGEAHLQAAMQQVEILRSYGEPARKELEQLVAALREAAEKAASGAAREPAARGW